MECALIRWPIVCPTMGRRPRRRPIVGQATGRCRPADGNKSPPGRIHRRYFVAFRQNDSLSISRMKGWLRLFSEDDKYPHVVSIPGHRLTRRPTSDQMMIVVASRVGWKYMLSSTTCQDGRLRPYWLSNRPTRCQLMVHKRFFFKIIYNVALLV